MLVIVLQDQGSHLIGHFGEQLVTLLHGEIAAGDRLVDQDLDVDFVIRGVDTGRIVDRIGVEASASQGRLDAATLGAAQIGAFADDPAAQFLGIDAGCVIGAVADIGMGLVRCLDIGADTAEPEQIDLRLQQDVDELVRRHLVLLKTEALFDFRRQLDRFGLALEHPAAGRDQL